jgi:hypothetical protein
MEKLSTKLNEIGKDIKAMSIGNSQRKRILAEKKSGS